jgi:transcriptional regulator with XRE-family HTH domain
MKQKTAGERIQAIRNEMSQAEFGKLLEASQGAVSAWERDDKDRSPSAAIYFRLASLAQNSEDSVFFLEQAGLDKDAVISVADVLLKTGGVKMDAILATAEKKLNERMGDGKQIEEKGKVVLVPPFTRGRWAAQKSSPLEAIEAWRVSNKASTFYIIATAPTVYSAIGTGVAPGDTIVFDASEINFDPLIGHEVLTESGDTLSIGRLVYTQERPPSRLALVPPSDPPDKWHTALLESVHAPMQEFAGKILGRVVARYPASANDFWKAQARAYMPKATPLATK